MEKNGLGAGRAQPHGGRPPGHQKSATKPRVVDQFYALVEDKLLPNSGGQKQLWRTLGQLMGGSEREKQKYNLGPCALLHTDPRITKARRKEIPKEFPLPDFVIDNNYIGNPLKREVSIFGLNDNINTEFLQKIANKSRDAQNRETVDVEVYHHPETRKHLGIGFILFTCYESADRFVTEYHGKTVMGVEVTCSFDPWAAVVSNKYESMTMLPCPVPRHLRGMDENRLVRLRDEIVARWLPERYVPSVPVPMDQSSSRSESEQENIGAHTPSEPFDSHEIKRHIEPLSPPHNRESRDYNGDGELRLQKPRTPQSRPSSRPSSGQRPLSRGAPVVFPSGPPPVTFGYGIAPPPYPGLGMPIPPPGMFASIQMPVLPGFIPPPPAAPWQSNSTVNSRPQTPPGEPIFERDKKERDRKKEERRRKSGEENKRREGVSSRNCRRSKRRRRRSTSGSLNSSSSEESDDVSEKREVQKKETVYERERTFLTRKADRIVEVEIRKVTKKTKKTYRRPGKHLVTPVVPGAEAISESEESNASESTGEIMRRTIEEKEKKKGKSDGHRWSSSSEDSEYSAEKRREKRRKQKQRSTEKVKDWSHDTPRTPCSVFPSCSNIDSSRPSMTPLINRGICGSGSPGQCTPGTPHQLPLMNVPPPPIGVASYLPNLHPPIIHSSVPPPNFHHPPPITMTPKIELRIIDDLPEVVSPNRNKPSIDDRLNSIFGITTQKRQYDSLGRTPSLFKTEPHCKKDRTEVEDMEVVGDSDRESETDEERERREKREMIARSQQAELAAADVCTTTLYHLRDELGNVICNDAHKMIEKVSWAFLDEFVQKRRQEIEEQNKNKAREMLLVAVNETLTPKSTPVKDSLLQVSPEGPQFFSMPKLPSFKRKKLPSPKHSRSASVENEKDSANSSDSDRAQIASSSTSDDDSESSSNMFVRKKKNGMVPIKSASSTMDSSSVPSESSSESEESEDDETLKTADTDANASSADSSAEDQIQTKNVETFVKNLSSDDVVPSHVMVAAKEETGSYEYVPSADDCTRTRRVQLRVGPRLCPETDDQRKDRELRESMEHRERMESEGYHPYKDHCYPKHGPAIVTKIEPPAHFGKNFAYREPLGVVDEVQEKVQAILAASKTKEAQAKYAAASLLTKSSLIKVRPSKEKKTTPEKKIKQKKLSNELLNILPAVISVRKTARPVISLPSKKFEKRSKQEELRILNDNVIFDNEDQEFMRRCLANKQSPGNNSYLDIDLGLGYGEVNWDIFSEMCNGSFGPRYVPFIPLELTPTPLKLEKPGKVGRIDLFYEDKELAGVRPHKSGSARTEGYYKVTHKEKRRLMRRPEGLELKTEVSERDETVVRHAVQMSREQKAMNRRLLTSMADTNSDLFKVNQLKYRKKMIKFARSRIHGWGLYALEPIAPDDMIVEYVGQKVRPGVADEREKAYERRGIGSSYLFRIDEDEVIDATKMGNFARFINHSCQPNCYAKVVTVDGDKRIVIYSKNLINKGDEITYDYKFPIEEDKIDCLCGAPNCRGTLN